MWVCAWKHWGNYHGIKEITTWNLVWIYRSFVRHNLQFITKLSCRLLLNCLVKVVIHRHGKRAANTKYIHIPYRHIYIYIYHQNGQCITCIHKAARTLFNIQSTQQQSIHIFRMLFDVMNDELCGDWSWNETCSIWAFFTLDNGITYNSNVCGFLCSTLQRVLYHIRTYIKACYIRFSPSHILYSFFSLFFCLLLLLSRWMFNDGICVCVYVHKWPM